MSSGTPAKFILAGQAAEPERAECCTALQLAGNRERAGWEPRIQGIECGTSSTEHVRGAAPAEGDEDQRQRRHKSPQATQGGECLTMNR